MEDSQIIELYWQKNADAISETSSKYGAYCYTIADNILHSIEDSEECVNDTWLHAWNAMPPQKPNVLRMFLAMITRSLSVNRFNARSAEKRGGGEITLVLADCLAGGTNVEAEYEVKELEQCIRCFVRGLPERDGNVFVLRYFFTEPVAVILEQCRTKRTNLYITDPVALHFAEHFEIRRLCDRDRHNAVGNRFMAELIDQLLQAGRLVSAETTHGVGIRTTTARELKDYHKPVEQVNGQITMMF